MKIQLLLLSLFCFFCNAAFAEAGSTVTGICKDGTEYTGASKKGACRGHKGLKEWYGDKGAAAVESSEEKAAKKETKSKKTEKSEAAGTATGLCKDGTEWTGASKKGACRGHKGLKEWYADREAKAAESTEDKPAKKEAKSKKAEKEEAAPAAASSGAATGLCKDGTKWTGESKRGACRGHKGLKEWYADKEESAKAKSETKAKPEEPAPAASSGAATGLCKDGTEWTGESKRGACRGHKGVKEWYADKEESAKPAAKIEKEEPPAKEKAKAAEVEESEDEAVADKSSGPAAGGGNGKVWVNTNSKIYHCEGSRFYGKTKAGEYMTEAEAQEKGYTANRKKVCSTAQ